LLLFLQLLNLFQFTTVSLTLTLRPNKHILFAIATSEKPETFTITEEAVCIQPEMEPEAKIDIPKGTFEGTQSQLFVNVSHCLVMTN
jgi:hypothetical protein